MIKKSLRVQRSVNRMIYHKIVNYANIGGKREKCVYFSIDITT